ncbi:unnamed protein product, partial [Nesidiocoris tenuis]
MSGSNQKCQTTKRLRQIGRTSSTSIPSFNSIRTQGSLFGVANAGTPHTRMKCARFRWRHFIASRTDTSLPSPLKTRSISILAAAT